MATITEELLIKLKSASDIESFFTEHKDQFLNKTTSEYLSELLNLRKLSLSVIAKNSGAGEYVYKIFNGSRKPSRDILISIAFSMNLALEEAQLLLRLSKFAILDSREERDSVILYGLTHGMTVFETDDLLDKQNLPTIN